LTKSASFQKGSNGPKMTKNASKMIKNAQNWPIFDKNDLNS
jgi:hypothetical protein